jgi:hypothetical protein
MRDMSMDISQSLDRPSASASSYLVLSRAVQHCVALCTDNRAESSLTKDCAMDRALEQSTIHILSPVQPYGVGVC